VAETINEPIYVFTKEAVLRSIGTLEAAKIHEHFPGYLAILRGVRLVEAGESVRMKHIRELHSRYLSVESEHENPIYVRPFASRGTRGLEIFNPNVAGSYGASSIRARGKLSEVIEVDGEKDNAVYSLKNGHAALARQFLLKGPVPVGALAAFFYRDFGFQLGSPDVAKVINIFRAEFGLSSSVKNEQETFNTLFLDDTQNFKANDLEVMGQGVPHG
jgi:hypothetical protein